MTGTAKSSTGISTSAVLYSVQPAYVCPWASPFLSIGIASRRATTNPVQTCFFGVNEKGMPCTKEKEFSLLRYDLCPLSVLAFQSNRTASIRATIGGCHYAGISRL